MAGRRQKAREGKWNGGQAPFGYRLQDGVLYLDEEEAQIVRINYDRFLNSSMGENGVAKWLNSHGYKKRLRGNSKYETFTAHFVKIVLDNPVYKGMIAYGRRATEKIDGTRNEFHKVKQDEFDLWKGKHEAIIDEITWGAAQLKRKATGVRNEQKFGYGHAHVLSGVLKCPICGAGTLI
ncbi:MAG: recombinase family protein [Peptoniphilaceae bacterium]|nr:recombinase family protein [Peptoniphilaceae bacterium]